MFLAKQAVHLSERFAWLIRSRRLSFVPAVQLSEHLLLSLDICPVRLR